uniref:Uncharacterized protein n=1 Tax=Avena sativa TaxID=4498 RepID=A0ACD5W2X7_AVESA
MGTEAGDSYHGDRDRWSSPRVVVCKGKRSKRQRVHAAPPPPAVVVAASAEAESSSSSVADDGWRSGAEEQEEEDMALCLMLLARGRGESSFVAPDSAAESTAATKEKEGRFRSRRPADGGMAGEFVYECRTCGRCFPSFQALGGHRTSHKKPRLLLLTAATSDEKRRTPSLSPSPPSSALHASADPTVLAIPATPPKHEASMEINVSRRQQQQPGRVHECSICGAEFASGQALGGHMRRHRPLVVPAPASSSNDAISIKEKSLLELDLNMPAPCDDDAAETTSPATAAGVATLFPASASALVVDCHY